MQNPHGNENVMTPWQVPVASIGATTTSSLTWRSNGQLRVTVIVKAAFSFVPNGFLVPAAPEPFFPADKHWDDDPARSVRVGSDGCPYRPRVDVLFTGHAYAAAGVAMARVPVRFALARGNAKVFDKVIEVVGDRNTPTAEPTPFVKMPLTYERAYGGPGFDANPVGVGFGSRGHTLPNVIYPAGWHKDTQPAALAPMASTWPIRQRLAGDFPANACKKTVIEISPSVDPSYFQTAPEDQRIAQLHGDEWILLEHLHPTHTRLPMKLPDVRGVAMVFGADGADIPISLRADTLLIDGDTERCIVTFRGSHPVTKERLLDQLRIAAGIEMAGMTMDWLAAKEFALSRNEDNAATRALDSNATFAPVTPFAIPDPSRPTAPSPQTSPASLSALKADAAKPMLPVGYSTLALAPPAALPSAPAVFQTPAPPPAAQFVPAPAPASVVAAPMPPPPPVLPVAPPAAPAPSNQDKPAWSWAKSEPTAQATPTKAPVRPAPPAAPPAKSVLYGGFTPLKK